ncbi:hypothetical protein BHE97_08295 [Aeromicrobium sp. PE09-221]|uniref:ABC transporter permease n=1 Tax=Aeromicrobium sp. PE09-221 TaxID=1898043 RepID=UPI000B3ED8F3|nr:ABC transporter permease [Aeromicrobium sp. PE09-221]OUZ10331.1 hypothetical protein BHE97_08295 [Aeromicrobium sp. PE09-221]
MILRLAWTSVATGWTRSIAVGVAIAIGVCLLSLTSILSDTARTTVDRGLHVEYEGADIVVSAGTRSESTTSGESVGASMSPEQVRAIGDVDGVQAVSAVARGAAVVRAGDTVRGIEIESPWAGPLAWQGTSSGEFSGGDAQIALSAQTARSLGVGVDDRVLLGRQGVDAQGFTVSAIVDTRGSSRHVTAAYGIVNLDEARRLAGIDGFSEVRLSVADGVSVGAVVDAVNALSPGGWPMTADELASGTADLFGLGLDVLERVTIVLVAVSLIVSALVLATTFTITVAGRSRQSALLRCVGASRGQVFGSVVVEAALVGALAALAGVIVAVVLTWLAAVAIGALTGVVSIADVTIAPTGSVLAPWLAGVVLAVIAAVIPGWTATRVPPVAALGASVGARPAHPVLAGLLSAIVSLGLVPVVRVASASLGHVASWVRWPSAALASANIARNAVRSAAVVLTVAIGVAVCSGAWISLQSLRHIAVERVLSEPGIDVVVGDGNGGGRITSDTASHVARIPGVVAAQPVVVTDQVVIRGKAAEIADANQDVSDLDAALDDSGLRVESERGQMSWEVAVAALTGEQLDRATHVPFDLGESESGPVVYLTESAYPPFESGARVTLSGPSGPVAGVRVAYVKDLPVPAMIAPELFDELGGSSSLRSVWLRLDSEADRAGVLDRVRAEAVLGGNQAVGGTLPLTVRIDTVVDLVVAFTMALLAAALVIAVIGVSNVMVLSVVERRRENGLLRALGLDTEQLRALLTTEATVLTALGSALGLLVGGSVAVWAVHAVAATFGLIPEVRLGWLALGAVVVLVVFAARWATARAVAGAISSQPARTMSG